MSNPEDEFLQQKSETKSRLRFTLEETSDDNIMVPIGGESKTRNDYTGVIPSEQMLSFSNTEEEQDIEVKRRRKRKPDPPILLFSIGAAIVWIIGAMLYMSNNLSGLGQIDMLSMIVTLLAPAAFSVLAGLLGESVNRSSQHSRQLVSAARRMMEPEKALNNAAKSSLQSVREEINRLEASLSSATSRLGDLENTIEIRAASLRKASEEARGGADKLVSTMENEQNRLSALLNALTELTNTAQQTTRMATIGFDEKAAQLTAAAEKITTNSNAATENASIAAQKLEVALNKTLQAIDGLDKSSERGELALTRAHDLMVMARVRADDAVGGVEEVISALRAEAESAKVAAAQSLATFEETTKSIRSLSEEAALYLGNQLKDNQSRIENLRQSSFEINQDADKFSAARLKDSQDLIMNSAAILDEAGDRINKRFADVAIACTEQARAIENMIDGLNSRLETLPEEAKQRAHVIEEALEQTLERFNTMGQKAAEDARQLDEAFQNRLKESYSALGEVMQRLGAFAGTFTPPNNEPPKDNQNSAKNTEKPISFETPKYEPLPPIELSGNKTRDDAVIGIEKETEAPKLDIANIGQNSINPEHAKAQSEPPKFRFDSVLSPRLAVQSVKNDNQIAENAASNNGALDAGKSNSEKAGLRGRIITNDDVENEKSYGINKPIDSKQTTSNAPTQLPEMAKAIPPISDSIKVSSNDKKEISADDDPFAGASFRSSTISHSSSNDWNWRDVLSAIDKKKTGQKQYHSLQLIGELELDKAISNVVLERLALAHIRDPEKGRIQTNLAIPRQIAKLKQSMDNDIDLRSFVVRFVEERHENANRGRLRGDELRLYLAGRAAIG